MLSEKTVAADVRTGNAKIEKSPLPYFSRFHEVMHPSFRILATAIRSFPSSKRLLDSICPLDKLTLTRVRYTHFAIFVCTFGANKRAL